MAERMISARVLDDITECPICTESYTDPRSLPCVHTFCLKCITEWSANKPPGQCVDCPICRAKFKIPKDGIGNLPKNIFVSKLLAAKEAPSANSTKLCGPCSANRTLPNEKTNQAVAFCLECKVNLCENCRDVHSKVKSSHAHHTVAVEGQSNLQSTCLATVCDKHPNKGIELYCLDCQEALCIACFVTQHNGHKSDEITKTVGSIRQDISKIVSDLQQTSLQTITRSLKNVQDKRQACVETFSVVERKVNARADQLKATIDSHQKQLLTQLKEMKIEKLEDIENAISEIIHDRTLLESFVEYCEELLERGSDIDIAKESRKLKSKSTEIKQLCSEDCEKLLSEAAVAFEPSELTSERDIVNVVGSLSAKTKLCPTLKFSPAGNNTVTAVCSIYGQLYVTRWSIQQITVYDTTTLTPQRYIGASVSSGRLWGLAACKMNNCLYVADTPTTTVYRINLTAADLNSAIKWSVAAGAFGLSVNSAHNLLVACRNVKKVQEYSTNGSLIREISDVNGLCHAIELSRGTIVLSLVGPVHGVSVKSVDGRDIKTYGSTTQGGGLGRMNDPRSLAVDSKGFVLVADMGNNRILVLNPELTEARPLPLPRDIELKEPQALCYAESLGHLYVGEFAKPYRLLVFSNLFNLSSVFSH